MNSMDLKDRSLLSLATMVTFAPLTAALTSLMSCDSVPSIRLSSITFLHQGIIIIVPVLYLRKLKPREVKKKKKKICPKSSYWPPVSDRTGAGTGDLCPTVLWGEAGSTGAEERQYSAHPGQVWGHSVPVESAGISPAIRSGAGYPFWPNASPLTHRPLPHSASQTRLSLRSLNGSRALTLQAFGPCYSLYLLLLLADSYVSIRHQLKRLSTRGPG